MAMLIRKNGKVLRLDTNDPKGEWVEVGEVVNDKILWYETVDKE